MQQKVLASQWFLDLELEDEPFDASSFSKNQERILEHQAADEFFAEVVGLLKERKLLSEEHFWCRRNVNRGLGITEEFST